MRRLLLFSSVLLAISMTLFGAYALYLHDTHQAALVHDASKGALAEWRAASVDLVADPAARVKAEALHAGPWALQIGARFRDLSRIASDILIIPPETLGLMFAGMAAFRSGLLTGAWPRTRLRRLAVGGLGIGLVSQAVMIVWDVRSGFEPAVLMGTMMAILTPFRVAQSLAMAALIVLLARPNGWLTKRIQAVGRMAFSNYLGTSILLVPAFAGWGLGLFDRLSRAEAWLFAPAVWLIMLAWSKPWLDRFRYGPLEWLWRSLSRGARQPMRRLAEV